MSATSGSRARPISLSLLPPPPISWPRWRRPCRRSCVRSLAGDRPPGADCSGNESTACGRIRATQRNLALAGRTASSWSGRMRAKWPRQGKPGWAAWRSHSKSSRRRCRFAAAGARARRAQRAAGPRHFRADARAHRSRALHRQPLLRQAGPCHRQRLPPRSEPRSSWFPGPVSLPDPAGVKTVKVETAQEMLDEVDPGASGRCGGICGRGRRLAGEEPNTNKIKKQPGSLAESELWKILTSLRPLVAATKAGPRLVIGFAAETEKSSSTPRRSSRARVATGWWPMTSPPTSGVMGGDCNTVHLVTANGVEVLAAAVKG